MSDGQLIKPLFQTVELNIGQGADVVVDDNLTVRVEFLELTSEVDELRGAVRKAVATVKVGDELVKLGSANYNLPVSAAGVKIDCPITRDNLANNGAGNVWGLGADARFRVWPGDSPLISPGTFIYPAKQKWFATATQIGNEPTWVDGGENPASKKIYYHSGVDIGGADGLTEIVSATDGLVVSAGGEVLTGYSEDTPVRPRYDLVYILDDRGWYIRYSHLDSIDSSVKLGERIKLGDPVGVLGKEGHSGGWAHLHFEATAKQPNGTWGTQSTYAMLHEIYCKSYGVTLLACARPHGVAWVDKPVILDATRSWAAAGVVKYQWQFSDGSTADVGKIERVYDQPGMYCETLEVTDGKGMVDYDFAYVVVVDAERKDELAPSIHASYYPTQGLKAGQSITFLVRTFDTTFGEEVWDFGDGSDLEKVKSDGNVDHHAKDGYARVEHVFEEAGRYFVSVQRSNERKQIAVGRLVVEVG